jgi:hypothetical protein
MGLVIDLLAVSVVWSVRTLVEMRREVAGIALLPKDQIPARAPNSGRRLSSAVPLDGVDARFGPEIERTGSFHAEAQRTRRPMPFHLSFSDLRAPAPPCTTGVEVLARSEKQFALVTGIPAL